MNEVFTALSQEDPNFAPAVTLLEDIREWIRGDIDFTGFLEMDKRFRRNNDGFSVRNNPFRIKVPRSYPPENKYFALEEFIEGNNLTEWDAIESAGQDSKQIVNVLTRNFFEQVKNGLVHSDIHPGNIRVTPDNQVAYLDRDFFTRLSVGDRLFLNNLRNSLDDPSKALNACFRYLAGQGVRVDRQTRDEIIQEVSQRNSSDITYQLLQLAVALRKKGIKFPLKITLLIKDFYYLDKMAKKAGYKGIEDAYNG
jgi:predicted unusual protein kinase regulating ubiquinone biosynthesis (AarF/ABC1/UbiB family)